MSNEKIGIRVHYLALGGEDLTSSTGKMTIGVINAVAQFARDILIVRTQFGLSKSKSQGKKLGGPLLLSAEQQKQGYSTPSTRSIDWLLLLALLIQVGRPLCVSEILLANN